MKWLQDLNDFMANPSLEEEVGLKAALKLIKWYGCDMYDNKDYIQAVVDIEGMIKSRLANIDRYGVWLIKGEYADPCWCTLSNGKKYDNKKVAEEAYIEFKERHPSCEYEVRPYTGEL